MLSVADEHLASLNPEARLFMHGQELNPESYAICKTDMLIKEQTVGNSIQGNTLSNDGLHGKHFDYALSNPPLRRGVEEDRERQPRLAREANRLHGRADREAERPV
ncbi:N-6 DNA methylase [Rhodoferax sp. OV413]|uniref:N-6 DNA methylase n=1 Tax=Rhodoferax sp. OV413 TaxID=1855285 RepID=UPI0035157E20